MTKLWNGIGFVLYRKADDTRCIDRGRNEVARKVLVLLVERGFRKCWGCKVCTERCTLCGCLCLSVS